MSRLLAVSCIALVLTCGSTRILAQNSTAAPGQDTLQAPGPRYKAGWLQSLLLGKEYRSLWTTPITVPVLDLRTFAGGLRPVSKGGGQQTKSLLLAAADGREFFFRSVDKDPSATLPPELRRTLAGSVVRDQTSSAFPTAPLVVAKLMDAAGILHGATRLVVLPSEGLGQFAPDFGGLMGFLEERVGGTSGPPEHWDGATDIIGTDSLVARTTRSPDDRVDARAFLKARLFDLLIGDWDRHSDQWVWARFGNTEPRRWVPIPRDRDQALVKYDGVLLMVARQSAPQLINFGPKYPYIPGATWNGRDLDRRYLSELDWPVWQSVVGALQSALTDAVIDSAVRALPPEHYAIAGASLSAALRSRRERLEEAAQSYYRQLGKQVDVYATSGPDRAEAVREPGGKVALTLSQGAADETYFRREFDASTTKEIRLYLEDGPDTVVVAGMGRGGPLLRVVAGGGQDVLIDSSRGQSERFYDDPNGPSRTLGSHSSVNRKPYVVRRKSAKDVAPRDWGHRWVASTQASFGPDLGLYLGLGRTLTTYGFRKVPYSSQHRFRGGFATGPTTYRFDYRGRFRRENSGHYGEVLLRASGIDVINFFGFGNETVINGSDEFYRVTQNAFSLQPSWVFASGTTSLQLGPVVKLTTTDRRPDRFLATIPNLYGTGNFGELGAGALVRHDSRDRSTAATRGLLLELGGNFYPAVWDVDSTFGEVHGEAATYLTARLPLDPTLALRVGGKKLWGQYPYFEAAFIGGTSSVRLYRVNRYAGDASAYGSAELRLLLTQLELVLPAEFGVFGLGDVGRVWLEGESSDKWHAVGGGGVWLAWLDRAFTFSLALASGERRTRLYAQAGFGF